MKILAFETSAKAASAAVMADGKLLAECYQNTGLTHSQTLMVMAQDLLQAAESDGQGRGCRGRSRGPRVFYRGAHRRGRCQGLRLGPGDAHASAPALWNPWLWGWAHGRAMSAP